MQRNVHEAVRPNISPQGRSVVNAETSSASSNIPFSLKVEVPSPSDKFASIHSVSSPNLANVNEDGSMSPNGIDITKLKRATFGNNSSRSKFRKSVQDSFATAELRSVATTFIKLDIDTSMTELSFDSADATRNCGLINGEMPFGYLLRSIVEQDSDLELLVRSIIILIVS